MNLLVYPPSCHKRSLGLSNPILSKGAPHPNAAKLLMAWLVSKEGIKGLLDSGYGSAYPPEAGPQAKMLADNNVGFMSIKSAKDIKDYAGVFGPLTLPLSPAGGEGKGEGESKEGKEN